MGEGGVVHSRPRLRGAGAVGCGRGPLGSRGHVAKVAPTFESSLGFRTLQRHNILLVRLYNSPLNSLQYNCTLYSTLVLSSHLWRGQVCPGLIVVAGLASAGG